MFLQQQSSRQESRLGFSMAPSAALDDPSQASTPLASAKDLPASVKPTTSSPKLIPLQNFPIMELTNVRTCGQQGTEEILAAMYRPDARRIRPACRTDNVQFFPANFKNSLGPAFAHSNSASAYITASLISFFSIEALDPLLQRCPQHPN